MSQTVHCAVKVLYPLRAVREAALGLAMVAVLAATAIAQTPLPRPSAENTLQVFVLDPDLLQAGLSVEAKTERARDIERRLDPDGLYVRVGIAVPYRTTGIEAYEAAQRARVPIALLGGPTMHHTHDWLDPSMLAEDLRNAQWLSDGTLGRGAERERLWACPSYYATAIRSARRAASTAMGRRVAELVTAYPGVVRLVAGPMEHCLSTAGYPERLADYSPWAVMQFRDWLTHHGAYGPGAELAQQGWPGGQVFADDPSPGSPAGAHASFNDQFGTAFDSWELRYLGWTAISPIAGDVSLLPPPGHDGYLAGGFDAPRSPTDSAALWELWQGFRRELVRVWAEEHLQLMRVECPGEVAIASVVYLPPEEAWREAAASTSCPQTGDIHLLDGEVDQITAWVRGGQLRNPWGAVVDVPYDPALGSSADQWLGPLVAEGARVIIIRAWEESTGGYGALAGSALEASLASWLEALDDHPLGSVPGLVYEPPPVSGLTVEALAEGNRVTWNTHPFEGIAARWEDWAPFAGYAVSRTHPEPLLLGTTKTASFMDTDPPPGARYHIRVLLR